ncbi:MAG: hypothetical protein JAY94_00380 [Candidatus Thiodiazotropha endolucinida]|nr:hypothetical protein [Candidatus Thiodiazotropha taylori]MCW4315941.1 hypothetical protein [Candidatus Thiodiazotropha taylori]
MEAIFRKLILLSMTLSLIGWLMPFIDYHWLNQNQITLLNQSGFDSVIPYNVYFYWFTCLIWLLLYFCLYFYVQIAKPAFFIYLVVSYALTLFHGTQVTTAIENIAFGMLTLANGVLISMLLFTSIGGKFAQHS